MIILGASLVALAPRDRRRHDDRRLMRTPRLSSRAAWALTALTDVAHLYRLALENHYGARWHAAAAEGVRMSGIARAIGAGLGVRSRSMSPEEAGEHFDLMEHVAGMDMSASNEITCAKLDWTPTSPSRLDDFAAMDYAASQ